MTAKKLFTILALGLITITTYSQTDSVKVEYSQEKVTKTTKLEESICDILTRREKNEKDLWKLNLLGTFFSGFNFSYERKIASQWSLNMQSKSQFDQSYDSGILNLIVPFTTNPRSNIDFLQELFFGLRYYHNMQRRIRVGKKAGFSGNYFELSLNNQYDQNHDGSYSSSGKMYKYSYNLATSLTFGYGVQRRIGKVGYIDVGAGFGAGHYLGKYRDINYNGNFFHFLPKVGIGIAF